MGWGEAQGPTEWQTLVVGAMTEIVEALAAVDPVNHDRDYCTLCGGPAGAFLSNSDHEATCPWLRALLLTEEPSAELIAARDRASMRS